MKPKTMRKILRRFQRLPLHHIDTNILVESGKETKFGNIFAAYLNRVGYKYNGVLCSSVLDVFSFSNAFFTFASANTTLVFILSFSRTNAF